MHVTYLALKAAIRHQNGGRFSSLQVGGSVGGLSCACLLIKEGFEVLVLEKARKIVPAGAVSHLLFHLSRF